MIDVLSKLSVGINIKWSTFNVFCYEDDLLLTSGVSVVYQ